MYRDHFRKMKFIKSNIPFLLLNSFSCTQCTLLGSNSVETSYSMAEELKHVLSYYKEEKQKKKLDILHTPDIFIDQRSTVREVQSWLKAKQFSSRVIKYLEGMNGRQVLGMHREALEAAFGKEEGSRLDSQITLSRSLFTNKVLKEFNT